MYKSRYDRCEQIFVLKKKIGTDDENGVYAPKLGSNWLNFYEKNVSIVAINPSNTVHFNRCYITHCHFHSDFNFIEKYLRKVKPNWKLSRFDTIFRIQVKALRKLSMLKKVAKPQEIVGRS